MKKIISLIMIIFTIISLLKAQTPLIANAGKDTLFCFNKYVVYDSIVVGGNPTNPTASGGVKPYTYKWSIYRETTKNDSSFQTMYCTNLDSANSIIRHLIWMANDVVDEGIFIAKVVVTDAKKNIAMDSSIITISFLILFDEINSPLQDSIQLNPMMDGLMGGTFNWTPDIGISNPNIENPTVKYSDIKYTLEVTDAFGCKYVFSYFTTDIKDGNLSTGFVSFKNPVSNGGTMNFTSDLLGSTLRVCTVGGVVVYETKVQELSIPLGQLITKAGIYFYTVTTGQGKVISGRFVRE